MLSVIDLVVPSFYDSVQLMVLLRCFQKLSRGGDLPDPTGPLSSSLSSSAIEEANTAVSHVWQPEQGISKQKNGAYVKLATKPEPKSANTLASTAIAR